jgi:hypothetical protein
MDQTTSIRSIRLIFLFAVVGLGLSFLAELIPGWQGDTIAKPVVRQISEVMPAPLVLAGNRGILYEQRLLVLNHPNILQRLLGSTNSMPGQLTGLSPFGMLYFFVVCLSIWMGIRRMKPGEQLQGMINVLRFLMNAIIGYLVVEVAVLFYMSHVVSELTDGLFHIESSNINGYLVMGLCLLGMVLIVNTQKAAEIQKEQELTI